MMRNYFPAATAGNQYRRGTIFGLTVAEICMLIAFILLMLIFFLGDQMQKNTELVSQLTPEQRQEIREGGVPVDPQRLETLEDAERALSRLTPEQRQEIREGGVPVDPQRLETLEDAERALSRLTPEQRQEIREGGVPVDPQRLETLEDAERALSRLTPEQRQEIREGGVPVDPQRLRTLEDAERALSPLTPEQRQKLREGGVPVDPQRLVEMQNAEEALSRLTPEQRQKLREGGVPVDPQRLMEMQNAEEALSPLTPEQRQELREGGVPVDPQRLVEMQNAEEALSRLTPEQRQELREGGVPVDPQRLETLEEIEKQHNEEDRKEERARRDVVDKPNQELSETVGHAGGQIGPRGRITLPEKALFEAGSWEVTKDSQKTLDELCSKWLTWLKKKDDESSNIDEIRIEGHSSSEWTSAKTQWDAWKSNLKLSQSRAQVVLVHCLDHVGNSQLREWAQKRLTAVGYSSSRPVASEGEEDREASRRVVFGFEVRNKP